MQLKSFRIEDLQLAVDQKVIEKRNFGPPETTQTEKNVQELTDYNLIGKKNFQDKVEQWFSGTDIHLSEIAATEKIVPEFTEISFSSSISSESPVSSVLLLFLYILLPTKMRQIFISKFPNVPFTAINTLEKLLDYIKESIESGSTSTRKIRLLTIGHQGSGKTSLIHSVRYVE